MQRNLWLCGWGPGCIVLLWVTSSLGVLVLGLRQGGCCPGQKAPLYALLASVRPMAIVFIKSWTVCVMYYYCTSDTVVCSPTQAATGLVVNIMCIAVLTATVNSIAVPVFNLNSFPEWAVAINGTNESIVCWMAHARHVVCIISFHSNCK